MFNLATLTFQTSIYRNLPRPVKRFKFRPVVLTFSTISENAFANIVHRDLDLDDFLLT